MKDKRKATIMILCYGASVDKASYQTKLGLRVTRVLLKALKSGEISAYTDFRSRAYRGYDKC